MFVKLYGKFCEFFFVFYRNVCVVLGDFYILLVIDLLIEKLLVDVICNVFFFCY